MRHRIFLIGTLLLALSMSGWGSVIAVAFCAHHGAQPSAMAENRDCCHAKLEQETEHCAAAAPATSSHEAMAMSEMTEAATPATEQTADAAEIEVAFGQAENCLHCVSRSGLPTTFVVTREAEQQKRDANIIAPQVLKRTLLLAPSFAPTLTARQNAPPGAIGCRHLLLNIFII